MILIFYIIYTYAHLYDFIIVLIFWYTDIFILYWQYLDINYFQIIININWKLIIIMIILILLSKCFVIKLKERDTHAYHKKREKLFL